MLEPRVLRIRLDPLEVRLRLHSLDLELRDEHRQLARDVRRDCDRPLGREEVEAREVLDVLVVEEDVAGEGQIAGALE